MVTCLTAVHTTAILYKMMTIVAIASSSVTTMTKKTMISNKETTTIVTIVSGSKTMMVIRTMIIN